MPTPHAEVTRRLAGEALKPPGRGAERALLVPGLLLSGLFALSIGWLLWRGVGVWGLSNSVVWGIDIASYLWWIGLGNAGAIVSSLLLLLRQGWRNSLNRLAESMTLFSAAVAGLFPILHLGQPWQVGWMFPVNAGDLGLWPQFRSPLAWDAYAILTYLGVILTLWYVGLIPDLAALRDRARRRGWAMAYGVLALGWRGSARHWTRWRQAYRLTAAIALPYIVVIHAGAALLLAGGPVPGWHSTLFPTLFMVGGTLAGFAMIILLTLGLRAGFGLGDLITRDHLDMLGRIALTTALIYLVCQLAEAWTILYGGDATEVALLVRRVAGAEAVPTWIGWIGSIGAAQLLWLPAVRRNPLPLALVAAVIGASIYVTHLTLLVSGLSFGHFPAMWRGYDPTGWEYALLAGSAGLFLLLLALFLRTLPAISIFEAKESQHDAAHHGAAQPDVEPDAREAAR